MTEPKQSTAFEAQRAKVKLRKRVKARKPKFQGQEVWRYKRIRPRWRRPRGVDSKMRQSVKGWPETVNVGYGGPRKARGLHPSGYEEVLVHNLGEIEGLNVETQAIRIAHTVGGKKRMDMLTKAREKGLHIINPRVVKEAVEEAPPLEEAPEAEKGEEMEGEAAGGAEETEVEAGEAEGEAEGEDKTGDNMAEEEASDEETR